MLRHEDCEFLTDRYGEIHGEIDASARAIVDQLVDSMFDEMTFVVRRGGQPGLLAEVELTTPPEDDHEEVLASWGRPMTEDDVRTAAVEKAVALADQFPNAVAYACQHPGNFFNRVCVRVFIPMPLCDARTVETIGNAMLDRTYAKAA
ncbi:MAG: hypothetical protein KDJ40_10795 [Hyphomicrobiales bacterium]|nr:hypothetical protein [Hyphomicrobiales bacterium]MCO5085972.1 hypothetical protein [Methylobacteriaceae bacterium]